MNTYIAGEGMKLSAAVGGRGLKDVAPPAQTGGRNQLHDLPPLLR
jgi:hypothetical protein